MASGASGSDFVHHEPETDVIASKLYEKMMPEIRSLIGNVNEKIETFANSAKQLRDEVEEKNTYIMDKEKQIRNLKKQIKDVRATTSKGKAGEMQAEIEKLQREVRKLKESRDELEKRLKLTLMQLEDEKRRNRGATDKKMLMAEIEKSKEAKMNKMKENETLKSQLKEWRMNKNTT